MQPFRLKLIKLGLLAGVLSTFYPMPLAQIVKAQSTDTSVASANGKYSNLIQVVNCPKDKGSYGEFYDYGYWNGTSWCGQLTQPGYWVWVNPTWYIWGKVGNSSSSKSAPCGDDQIQFSYDTRSSRYHSYSTENEVCSVNMAGCNKDSVFKIMLSQANFIAPTDDTAAVTNCKITDVNLPMVLGTDSVRTLVDQSSYAITNYTRENHFLHPGRVTRKIVERNGKVFVTTFGEGTGYLPRANEKFAPRTWNDVDRQLIRAVQSRLSTRHWLVNS